MKQIFISLTCITMLLGMGITLITFQKKYYLEKELEHHYHRVMKSNFTKGCLTEAVLANNIKKELEEQTQMKVDVEVKYYQCYPKIMRVVVTNPKMKLKFDRTLIEERID
ncbi:MAG TPA: hypothetical protein VIG45_01985 [Erysipelothrix sp.]